jgi:hypothetical protein
MAPAKKYRRLCSHLGFAALSAGPRLGASRCEDSESQVSKWPPSLLGCNAFVPSSCARSAISTDERFPHFKLGAGQDGRVKPKILTERIRFSGYVVSGP